MTASAVPQINVYTSLHLTVALGSDLDVHPDNWCWIHCLALPLKSLDTFQFSQRPYKWIHYIIGIVMGTQGVLCTSPDLPNVVDYNAVLPTKSIELYYHTSIKEKQRMLPIDSHILHTHITSSVSTCQRAGFHSNVAEWDGEQCVLTRAEAMDCDAVHLLPHGKGDMVCYLLLLLSICPHLPLQLW
jgi:hypothetical protein